MRKHLLLITLFYLFSLAFAAVSFAEYEEIYSDYVYANDGSEWSSNISCRVGPIPYPQKTVDVTVLDDTAFYEYIRERESDRSGIYVEYYGPSNGKWCETDDVMEELAKLIFKKDGRVYAEYNGKMRYGSLLDGRFTFANGEVWSVDKGQNKTIDVPSSDKIKIIQAREIETEKRLQIVKIERDKREQIAKVEREKNEINAKQKLAKFQKTIKSGSKVSFYVHGYKLGMVTSVKGDMVKVQVTNEIPLNARRLYNVRPYDEWVNKKDVNFPDAWSF